MTAKNVEFLTFYRQIPIYISIKTHGKYIISLESSQKPVYRSFKRRAVFRHILIRGINLLLNI